MTINLNRHLLALIVGAAAAGLTAAVSTGGGTGLVTGSVLTVIAAAVGAAATYLQGAASAPAGTVTVNGPPATGASGSATTLTTPDAGPTKGN
jgi:hypothetical protein